MSEEIVVGACYRDVRDGEIVRVVGPEERLVIVRVVGPEERLVGFPAVVLKSGEGAGHGGQAGARVWRDRDALTERVPDPMPAIADDAEPPLAGEMTLRQVEAWRASNGIGEMSLVYVARTGLWHAYAERGHEIVSHASASDPQDAITTMMAKVSR